MNVQQIDIPDYLIRKQSHPLGNRKGNHGSYISKHGLLKNTCPLMVKNERTSAVARLVAAMRKLIHFAYGVLKSDQPFNAEYRLRPA
ncbi:MAG: hypothetical protein H7Y37_14770 [Anaerolineae bacterium]|nr:hypothetical protein [Gloeobacterales cyanobacterium ES-bin-313]